MIVGLTGGMGSGKTTVGKFFIELGIPIYNSDVSAKELMKSSKKVKKSIIKLLGKDAYKGKSLNKRYIAESVFNNRVLLKKLNAIVHPAVRKDFLKWIKKQDAPYVIQETALIFENDSERLYDKIVLVTAPLNLRLNRVMDRDGSTENEVAARLKNQLVDAEKIPLSDFVIENVELLKTKAIVEDVHSALLEYS